MPEPPCASPPTACTAARSTCPGEPASEPAPSRARHLADAATKLAAGRDLLHTHIVLGPDGLAQERSEWAPVVTSLPVTRALANEIAAWSARLAPFTAWLAGLATPHVSRLLADQLFVLSPREELASASQWLRAASAALHPALDADPVRPADAELLDAIPAAFPPQRQPLGLRRNRSHELCDGIAISASRLRAAVYRGRDRVSWSPEVTSGGWQWMAQAAAVTSHLSELALRSLAARAGQLTGLAVTQARLHGAADAMIGMRDGLAAGRPDVERDHHRAAIAVHAGHERGERSAAPDGPARLGQPAVDTRPRPPRPPQGPGRPCTRERPRSPPSCRPRIRRPTPWPASLSPTSTPCRPPPGPGGCMCRPGRCPTGYDVPSRVRARADRHGPGSCRTPTTVLPKQAPGPRESWTSWPSRWQRPARPWPWHGRRHWPRPGDGAVRTPGPIMTPP